MRKDLVDVDIIDAANTFVSMQEAARHLGVPYGTFKNRAVKLGVYKPNPYPSRKEGVSKVRQEFLDRTEMPLQDILEGKHPQRRGIHFKRRLYEKGIKKEQCEECGQGPIWNGKPLTLELDHINGNSSDHRLVNLKILCLHCHSQTPTYRRKKSARVA